MAPFVIFLVAAFSVKPAHFFLTPLLGAAAALLAFGIEAALPALFGMHPHPPALVGLIVAYGIPALATVLVILGYIVLARPEARSAT